MKREPLTVRNFHIIIIHNIDTIKYLDFKKILDEEFKSNRPAESLVYCMFDSKVLFNYLFYFRV